MLALYVCVCVCICACVHLRVSWQKVVFPAWVCSPGVLAICFVLCAVLLTCLVLHDVQEQHWNKNAATARDSPARSLEELKQKRERQRRPMVHKAVDIDGDGVVDDVEIELSKILDTIEGEDLDGDGIVTEEELMQTKIKKGKEILARRFVESNPAIHNFWTDFRGMDNEAMVKAICSNVDYRMLMSNLTNKAMQFEMLYDSRRIGDSLRIMATDRDRRWQQKKAQIAENRNKLFQAKYNATVNAHRQSKVAEREHELRHAERKRQSFTPLLKGTSLKQRPTH